MAATYTMLVIVLLSSFTVVMSEPSACTENIDNCTAPLVKYDVEDSIVPSHTVEVMQRICRTYEQVKECMRKFEHKCTAVDKRWFQGVHDSYEYLCEDHFDEYKQYRKCLATPELHVEGKTCNWTLHFSFNSDIYQSGSNYYKAQRICQYSKTYLSCVQTLVESFCGKGAGLWQRGYDEASLHPLLSYIGCQVSSNDYEQKAIITGITVTLILVVVFIVAGVFLWIYDKKKQARHARQHLHSGPHNIAAGQPQGNGSAVYRIGAPGAAPELILSPYAYTTPSPIPPPYAEKPPAYGLGVNGFGSVPNGTPNNFPPIGTTAVVPDNYNAASDVKMPLPPDYEPLGHSVSSGAATGEASGSAPVVDDSDYLVLQPPPEADGLYMNLGNHTFPAGASDISGGSNSAQQMPRPAEPLPRGLPAPILARLNHKQGTKA